MASLNPAVMAASAIPGMVQMGFGIADRIKANKLSKQYNLANMPKQEMSQGFNQYMNLQEQLAQTQMPGYGETKSAIGQATSQSLTGIKQVASSESGALSAMLGTLSSQQSMLRDLSIRALQYGSQMKQNLGNAYQQKGQLQSEMWQQNNLLPWQMGMNQVDSLRGAGAQNVAGGLDNMAAAGIYGMNNYANQQAYGNMMPDNGNGYNAGQNYNAPFQYSNRFQGQMNNAYNQQLNRTNNIYSNS